MDPPDLTRRRLLIGLGGLLGLGAVGGVAWLLGDAEDGVAAGATTTSTTPPSTTAPAPSTTVPTTTTAPATTAATTTAAPTSTTTSTTAAPETTTTSTTMLPELVVPVICREAWGASPPTGEFTEHTIKRITVHHTAAVIEDNSLSPGFTRKHQADHQNLGWPDIAYHFLIDRNGHVYEGRPCTAVGDTRTSYDPTGHLLIAAKGNFEEQELTAAQLESLVAMLAWGVTEFGVPRSEITGHRDWAATACPGEAIYGLLESGELTDAVTARLEHGSATLEISCGEDATRLVADIEAGLE